MKAHLAIQLAVFAVTALARTEVMLPLYTPPGGIPARPDWQAAVDAIRDNQDMHFYVVINPNSGPKNTSSPGNMGSCNLWNATDPNDPDYLEHGCNRDWSTNVHILNQFQNVQTLGYIATGYGNVDRRSIEQIEEDIAEWAAWDIARTWNLNEVGNISIHGLWFDEAGITLGNRTEYLALTSYARQVFTTTGPSPRHQFSIVMNPGSNPDQNYEDDLFGMADAVVVRETCWTSVASADCPPPYEPFDYATLRNGFGLPYNELYRNKTVVLVHQVRGPPAANNQTLYEQVKGVVGLGLHSTYFTSGNWSETRLLPASVGVVAESLSRANNETSAGVAL
ncbi:Spherulation-specific family 4-domain-containing protein [Chaetomium sp. MPI-CAGE-AT-0009]|nr:Spherulation-specific family 4-domain-containing protein [Chaetomium sp. MPI-CAGE-AT-0009]